MFIMTRVDGKFVQKSSPAVLDFSCTAGTPLSNPSTEINVAIATSVVNNHCVGYFINISFGNSNQPWQAAIKI